MAKHPLHLNDDYQLGSPNITMKKTPSEIANLSMRASSPPLPRNRSGSTMSRQDSLNGVDASSPLPSNLQISSSVHPPISELDSVSAYIEKDPSNLIQLLPDICASLENTCLSHPELCSNIWNSLQAILTFVEASKAQKEADIKSKRPDSPVCKPKPYSWTNVHGEDWSDDFFWLNERENTEVLDYIQKENEYSVAMLAHTKPLQKILYKEFVSRLDEQEETVRIQLQDGWTYYSKKVPGEEYRVHCRLKDGGLEEVYLDENQLANSAEYSDSSFFCVGFIKYSPTCNLVAYGIDSSGNERYTVKFLNLETKEVLVDKIEGVYEDFEFGNDGLTVYYTLLDDHERAYQFKRHLIGTLVETDQVLYHETDEMFYLSLTRSSDGKFVLLNSAAQITSETRCVSADSRTDLPVLLIPRRENISYTCDHHGNSFYILTNEDAKNNWMYRVPTPSPNHDWEELLSNRETVIEHRDFVLIEDFQLRKKHLIVFERTNCLQNVRIVELDLTADFSNYHYVSFSEVVYSLWPGSVNEEVADLTKATQFETNILRFTYTSFVQPKQVMDYDMDTKTMTVVHEEVVHGIIPYDQSLYSSRRVFATGFDGTAVPVSIVFRRDLLGMNMSPSQVNPVLLHAYGAYGTPVNPIFSASRLSLLDRGFIYAAAHVRGGADMGNAWYEEGKLGKKPNTFNDFCSAAEYLIKEGYTSNDKLSIYGRSAGGLLIGAVINMRPDLFRAALTEVPFVDVINTMFDATIPWTAFEYEEWGNPNDGDIYNVMKTYCPYTNIDGSLLARDQYPHLLVVGGVAFFEPLKLIAKMRSERRRCRLLEKDGSEIANEERLLLLRIDDAGHGGASGQYSYLDDLAYEYAFLIWALQAPTKPFYTEPFHLEPPGTPTSGEFSFEDGNKKKRRGKEEDEKAYRSKDRGQNRLFQWINTFF